MRHKEKWAALVLALALLVQPLLLPAQAAPTVYFTAVNDYVLELSDDTMPFWSGGYLYLPSTIFTGSVGRQLGISYSRYVNRQTVILYSSDTHALIFDLANNTTKDNQGNAYAQTAILRGGVVFVPEPVITSFSASPAPGRRCPMDIWCGCATARRSSATSCLPTLPPILWRSGTTNT